MNTLVADSSVILKWFHAEGERHRDVALTVLDRYLRGSLTLAAPPVLLLEIVNVGARSWLGSEPELLELVDQIDALRLRVSEIGLDLVARWAARGLTAYDASYVALAEQLHTVVVTDDQHMLSIAPGIAVPLATFDIDAFLAS